MSHKDVMILLSIVSVALNVIVLSTLKPGGKVQLFCRIGSSIGVILGLLGTILWVLS